MARLRFDLYTRPNQVIVDGLIFATSFALAYAIRFEALPQWQHLKQFLLWLPYLVALRLYVNWRMGIYRFIWRYVSLSDAIAIIQSLSMVTAVLLALRLLYAGWLPFAARLRIPLTVIALEFLISSMGCLGARALRRVLYQRQREKAWGEGTIKRMLLVGAGRAGAMVARELAARPEVKLVGFLDDDPKKIGSVINGVRVRGRIDVLPSVVTRDEVEEVVICIPRPPRATLKKLWALSDHLAVQMKIVPTLEEVLQGKVNIAAFRDVQMADLLGRETVKLPASDPSVVGTYQGKRILVTGAGGSIGSELATQLIELGPEQLVLLDKDENSLNDVYVRLGNSSTGAAVHPVVADIRFPDRLRGIFSRFRPEVVFHAAAHKHVPLMERNPCEAILNNVVGTRNLVELAQAFGVGRFVFISTDKAVKPVSIMGASKRIGEMVVQAQEGNGQTRFACVRFGNVMGSRGSVIPLFQQQIARGGPLTVTHPDVQRFLMTIPEAVRLVIQAGTLGTAGEIFILDMGDPVPILDLARDLVELSGLRLGQDIQIEMTQLRPGEKLSEELIDEATERLTLTRFEKIRMVKGCPFDSVAFFAKLAELERAAHGESSEDIHRILRELNIGFDPEAAHRPAPRAASQGA
jgi:FlaA1/EpsC-like NDP-sugar epimerase